MAPDPLLEDVAGAVLDGDPVDWADVEARADATATSVVKSLEVLSLVAAAHRQKGADAARSRNRDVVVETWGHLRLLERIGRGAFGEVYRAWDTRLDREVALKLLPAPAGARASSIIEEGRLVARVRHPGVVTIHGAEQIGDRVGLWMEYIRGRTLEELLEEGGNFGPGDVIQIGVELSSAVAAVHDAGVIHRDIKAHNVIRAEDGRVMLMDFGAGLELATAATAPAGTPLYAAPELFAGQPAAVRSDIYSLGVVLYHLLTGTYPVTGQSLHDVRLAHERGDRTALADARPDVPRRLTRAIDHAIDPQPDARCQSAVALAVALQAAERGSAWRWIRYAGVAAAVLILLWASQPWRNDAGSNQSLADIARAPAASWWAGWWPTKPRAIAILPFQNLGTVAGSDLIADGLTYEVTSILATVDGLDVRSATSAFAFKGMPRDLAEVRRQLSTDIVVEGELSAAEDHVRVNARLVSVADNKYVWSGSFDRRGQDVLTLQRELALAIVNHLRLELGGGQRRYDIDPALQLKFWTARALAEKNDLSSSTEAVRRFEDIVAAAPSYAPAWAGLASAVGVMVRLNPESVSDDDVRRMKDAALQAYSLDPLLAEANAARGLLEARDLHWSEAREFFARALRLNPSLTKIHTDAATFLLLPLERLDEAMDLLAIARRVDPASLDVRRTLALIQVQAGQYEQAIQNARSVLVEDPAYPYVHISLGRALALSGRPEESLRTFEERPAGLGYLGYIYAVTGRRDEAESLAAKAVSPAQQMLIYGALGDKDRAFEALDRVAATNPWRAATWMLRPEMAILQDDPRFAAMRARLQIAN